MPAIHYRMNKLIFIKQPNRTQFHWLPFSKAVELGELSDYKVAIFGISEHEVNAKLAGNTGRYGSEININDATRIIGCWRALQNPENEQKDDETLRPLKRVIAFTNRIDNSISLQETPRP